MAEQAETQEVTAAAGGNPPTGFIGQIRHFIHEVMLEMKKVIWPTQNEVINTTIIVILTVLFFSVFLFVADILLSQLIHLIEAGAGKLFS
jgi:preprotein translocase subunit SecE